MTEPFRVQRENGIVWVDKAVDEAFRKALLDGIPRHLRPKMVEALAATPQKDARGHSERYFKGELASIMAEVAPLLFEINRYLTEQCRLPGLYDWLNATNFGNDYRMIKAFKAWSEMKVGKPADG